MPILPDDQFEQYLRQFRPVVPEEMQFQERVSSHWRPRAIFAWTALAAVVLIMMALALHRHPGRPDSFGATASIAGAEQLINVRPLTIGSANALLVSAPSFKTAIDRMAFHSIATPLEQGTHSALAELGKDELSKDELIKERNKL
jgi:hypothetical protein